MSEVELAAQLPHVELLQLARHVLEEMELGAMALAEAAVCWPPDVTVLPLIPLVELLLPPVEDVAEIDELPLAVSDLTSLRSCLYSL